MADDLHPVIRLLIARMESHPEEFRPHVGRWASYVEEVRDTAEGADLDTFNAAYSKLLLTHLHERVMDELLNGEERRAEEQRKREEEARTKAQQYHLLQQAQMAQNQYGNNLQNALLQSQQNSLSGLGLAQSQSQSQSLMLGTGGNEAMRINPNGEIRLGGPGGEVLDANILRKMKRKLGVK